MAAKKFVWLFDDGFPRPGSGPALVKGKKYKFSDFPEGVPEEWIRTGAAKLTKDKEESEVTDVYTNNA